MKTSRGEANKLAIACLLSNIALNNESPAFICKTLYHANNATDFRKMRSTKSTVDFNVSKLFSN